MIKYLLMIVISVVVPFNVWEFCLKEYIIRDNFVVKCKFGSALFRLPLTAITVAQRYWERRVVVSSHISFSKIWRVYGRRAEIFICLDKKSVYVFVFMIVLGYLTLISILCLIIC